MVHAWVLARANRDRALELFVEALRSDVADVQGGTTAEGIHLAAMAGTVDLLLRCFAGVELRGKVMWLRPLTQGPRHARITIFYRDHLITLSIADHTVRISSGPGNFPPVRVGYRSQQRDLAPGQSLAFPL